MTDTLYETDVVTWAEQQAETLRRLAREGTNLPLDWENLAEEIDDVGSSQQVALGSLIAQIIAHLLKLACSPARGPRRKWFDENVKPNLPPGIVPDRKYYPLHTAFTK